MTLRLCIIALLATSSVGFAGEKLNLTIEDAVQIALERNRSLKMARQRTQSSVYSVKDAKTAFFPRLNAKGTYTRLDERPYMDASSFGQMFAPLMAPFSALVDSGFLDAATLEGLQQDGGDSRIYVGQQDNYNLNLSVQQPLFTGGTIWHGYQITKLAEQSEEYNLHRDENQVRYDVTAAYLGLVKAKDFLTITEESITQVKTHISDLQNLSDEGMIIENDLLRARVQLSNVRLLNSRAANGVRLADSYLCHLLGIDLETEIEPKDLPPVLFEVGEELESYTQMAQVNRPEIKTMNNNIKIGERLVEIQRGRYLPSLALVGNYDWKRPNQQYEPDFYGSWNITLALQVELFNWGSTHYNIQKARIAQRQIVESYNLLADGISLEVKQAFLNLGEAREALDIAEETIIQAEENFRMTKENFHEGVATNADLLDAQTSLTSAKIDRATTHADLLIAQARLNLVTAGPK